MDSNLNFYRHCASVISKANQCLSVIIRSFTFLDAHTLLLLYKSLICPVLQYGNVVWGPRFKLDQQALENVQRRATKLVPFLYNYPYNKILHTLDLPSLYYRSRRGDMIATYILTNKVNIDYKQLFHKATSLITGGHNLKVFKPRNYLELRRNFFIFLRGSSMTGLVFLGKSSMRQL